MTEQDAVLYAFGPERLVIGRFCAIAAGVRFLLPGANHADDGPSTFPFGIFGGPWADTMDLVFGASSRGDTVVGHDVRASSPIRGFRGKLPDASPVIWSSAWNATPAHPHPTNSAT